MSKNKKILFIAILCFFCMVFVVSSVSAVQQPSQCTPQNCKTTAGCICNPLGTEDVSALIGTVIKAVLGVVGSIALLMFIYGGFLWLTSAGSEQKITKGKQVIVWATIGLTVIFLSYTLVDFVIKGLTGGSSGSGGGSSDMECCYSTCSNGQISSPSMTDKGSCTTKYTQPLSGGSCSPVITVGDCN